MDCAEIAKRPGKVLIWIAPGLQDTSVSAPIKLSG